MNRTQSQRPNIAIEAREIFGDTEVYNSWMVNKSTNYDNDLFGRLFSEPQGSRRETLEDFRVRNAWLGMNDKELFAKLQKAKKEGQFGALVSELSTLFAKDSAFQRRFLDLSRRTKFEAPLYFMIRHGDRPVRFMKRFPSDSDVFLHETLVDLAMQFNETNNEETDDAIQISTYPHPQTGVRCFVWNIIEKKHFDEAVDLANSHGLLQRC